MDAKDAADFPVEVDFTALYARSEQRARDHFEYGSSDSITIGIYDPADADTVADFELRHSEIIQCLNCYGKELFLRRIVDVEASGLSISPTHIQSPEHAHSGQDQRGPYGSCGRYRAPD